MEAIASPAPIAVEVAVVPIQAAITLVMKPLGSTAVVA